jgi:hypothetical protein
LFFVDSGSGGREYFGSPLKLLLKGDDFGRFTGLSERCQLKNAENSG